MQVRAVATLVLVLAAGCGGPQPTPPVARDPRCAGFELDVERMWNAEARAEIRSAFGGTGVAYAERMSESVVTKMDDATRDWVMLKESLCTDCLVRGLISKEVYAARSSCYDAALILQRSSISLFKGADGVMVEKALEVFTGISDRLESCERESMWAAYGDDAGNPNADAVRRAEEKTAESRVALALGRREEAALAAVEGQKSAEEASSGRLEAAALLQEGLVAREYARYDEAQGKLEQAMAASRKIADRVGEADALVGLGWVKLDRAEYRDALDLYDRAEALYAAALHPDDFQLGGLSRHRGMAWHYLGEYAKAQGFYERALAIFRARYGEEHPDVARALNDIGAAWDSLGEYEKALGFYERSLATKRGIYGDHHPLVAASLSNVGSATASLGFQEKALGFYEQALEIDRSAYGPEHPDVAMDLINIGVARRQLGEHEQARGVFEQALAILRKTKGDEHPLVGASLSNLGLIWSALGEHEKSLGFFEQALAIDEKVSGEGHPDVAIDLQNLGAEWEALGECEKALPFFERALAIREKMLTPDHPDLVETRVGIARCRKKKGK